MKNRKSKVFEDLARRALENEIGCSLDELEIDINGKGKKFDLVNIQNQVVGDVKNYTITRSGNTPSAKISTLNEYVWLMGLVEKFSKKKWRKILVIGEDKKFVEYYIRIFERWLDNIEIFFFDSKKGLVKMR